MMVNFDYIEQQLNMVIWAISAQVTLHPGKLGKLFRSKQRRDAHTPLHTGTQRNDLYRIQSGMDRRVGPRDRQ